jgi:eukaryotic-like serine/threonine-protein kinase
VSEVSLPVDLNVTPAHVSVPRDLTEHTLAKRYHLLEVIGGGGTGTVYRATDLTLDKQVAVKVLDLHVDPVYQERFAREGRLAMQLSHPNIVEVTDSGRCDGVPYIAMELLEGVTLSHLLHQERVLPWRRTLHFARQICGALGFAHEMGLVHRDLKPANCFVLHEGTPEEQLKLLDFGLARFVHSEAMDDAEVTRSAMVMGTPTFMAPEQARGEASAQSDLYSLGIVLFRMLTGQVPFTGPTPIDIIVKHLQAPLPWFEELGVDPRVPIEVEHVIRRCLEKEPRARFASAEAVARALDTAELEALQRPAAARTPTAPSIPIAPAARHPTPATPLPLTPTPLQQSAPSQPAPATELFSAQRSTGVSRWPARLGALLALSALGAGSYALATRAPSEAPAAPAPAAPAAAKPSTPEATAPEGPSGPRQVLFRINTLPAGATVRMGPKVMGITPASFQLEADASGEATAELTLELKGYQSITFFVTSLGPRFDLMQRLTKGSGRVTLPSPIVAAASTGATPEVQPTAPVEPPSVEVLSVVAPPPRHPTASRRRPGSCAGKRPASRPRRARPRCLAWAWRAAW